MPWRWRRRAPPSDSVCAPRSGASPPCPLLCLSRVPCRAPVRSGPLPRKAWTAKNAQRAGGGSSRRRRGGRPSPPDARGLLHPHTLALNVPGPEHWRAAEFVQRDLHAAYVAASRGRHHAMARAGVAEPRVPPPPSSRKDPVLPTLSDREAEDANLCASPPTGRGHCVGGLHAGSPPLPQRRGAACGAPALRGGSDSRGGGGRDAGGGGGGGGKVAGKAGRLAGGAAHGRGRGAVRRL